MNYLRHAARCGLPVGGASGGAVRPDSFLLLLRAQYLLLGA
jgi:hypothetical protein